MRKPVFAYSKTKAQISFAVTTKLIRAFVFEYAKTGFRGNHEADQGLCFRYIACTIPLLP